MIKKKILILTQSLKLGGGVEKVASTLGSELNNIGYDVSFLTFYHDYEERDTPLYNIQGNYYSFNWKFITIQESESLLPKLKKIKKKLTQLLKSVIIGPYYLSKFCNSSNYELVISFCEDMNLITLLSRLLFRNNSKVIVSIRVDPQEHYRPSSFMQFIWYLILNRITIRRLYHLSDLIICVSKAIQYKLYQYKIPLNKLKTIYNPHDIEGYLVKQNEEIEKKYEKIFTNNFVFLNIGRLVEQKGQIHLIRSFVKVVKKNKKAKLIIIGDYDVLYLKLKKLIRIYKMDNNIILIGPKTNIFPYLKYSKCLVQTSLYEGLPNVLIEGLSLNKLIISTDCRTGPREILCPELKINDKINYPYFGKYGILIPDLIKLKKNSKNQRIAVKKFENNLSNLLIKIIEDPKIIENYSEVRKRAKIFEKNKIINKWDKEITNII